MLKGVRQGCMGQHSKGGDQTQKHLREEKETSPSRITVTTDVKITLSINEIYNQRQKVQNDSLAKIEHSDRSNHS